MNYELRVMINFEEISQNPKDFEGGEAC